VPAFLDYIFFSNQRNFVMRSLSYNIHQGKSECSNLVVMNQGACQNKANMFMLSPLPQIIAMPPKISFQCCHCHVLTNNLNSTHTHTHLSFRLTVFQFQPSFCCCSSNCLSIASKSSCAGVCFSPPL